MERMIHIFTNFSVFIFVKSYFYRSMAATPQPIVALGQSNCKISHSVNYLWFKATEENADLTFINQTKQITLGVEIPNKSGLYPVVEIGRMYSEDFSEGVNIFNAGVNYCLNQ